MVLPTTWLALPHLLITSSSAHKHVQIVPMLKICTHFLKIATIQNKKSIRGIDRDVALSSGALITANAHHSPAYDPVCGLQFSFHGSI